MSLPVLPPSQQSTHVLLHELLQELRYSWLAALRTVETALRLTAAPPQEILDKARFLGYTTPPVSDADAAAGLQATPALYALLRKLRQHRGTAAALDSLLHTGHLATAGLDAPLTDTAPVLAPDTGYHALHTTRDNTYSPTLYAYQDGYIIIPYTHAHSTTLQRRLASNPLLYQYLPAGYTYLYLGDLQGYATNAVLWWDNYLSYQDAHEELYQLTATYPNAVLTATQVRDRARTQHPLYEEAYELTTVTEHWDTGTHTDTLTHTLHTRPATYRDHGLPHTVREQPQYPAAVLAQHAWPGAPAVSSAEYCSTAAATHQSTVLHEWRTRGWESPLQNVGTLPDLHAYHALLPQAQSGGVGADRAYLVSGVAPVWSARGSYHALYRAGRTLYTEYTTRRARLTTPPPEQAGERQCHILSDALTVYSVHSVHPVAGYADETSDVVASSRVRVTTTVIIDIEE